MSAELTRLFNDNAAASFDKQLALNGVVGDQDWRVDLAEGVLTFGQDQRWPVQLLGTESEETGTWLWGWANPSAGIPPSLLGSARLLQLLGEERHIAEFTEPEYALGDIDGHYLAIVASGVCRAEAYYRAPYEGGAAFLLLQQGLPLPPAGDPLTRVTTVFPQALAALPITDHRRTLTGYLRYLGLDGQPEGAGLVVRQDGELVLVAGFDEWGRLARLEVILHS